MQEAIISTQQNNLPTLEIFFAEPRGFCAGVRRAVDIVELALKKFGSPIYVKHEIVHNKLVVESFRSRGVVFIEDLSEVPAGSIIIFSAHGVSQEVEDLASNLKQISIDATCPLVKKVHNQVVNFDKNNMKIIMIGHQNHPEVLGTVGRSKQAINVVSSVEEVNQLDFKVDEPIAVVTQTTLSLDDTKIIMDSLKDRFTNLHLPAASDICYATQNRQNAVKELAKAVEMILVIGNHNSSNSNRLKEVSIGLGTPSYLIQSADELDLSILTNFKRVGLTSGASTPEELVSEIISKIATKFAISPRDLLYTKETIHFKLPAILEE